MKKKLLLINPMQEKSGITQRKGIGNYPPLCLGYIAALTPSQGWDIEIIDESVQRYSGEEADLVGLTSLTHNVPRAYQIATLLRKKGMTAIMGGIHASTLPEEASRYVDAIVVGEAEKIWAGVLKDFEKKQLKKIYKGERWPLIDLPHPRRDLFSKNYSIKANIQTARGCPMRCDFCSVTAFNGGTFRQRPVKEVLDELETLEGKVVAFVDDNILGYGKNAVQRALHLFKGIVDRGLKIRWFSHASLNFVQNKEVVKYAKKSGCFNLFIGFESLNEESLKKMHKVPNVKAGVKSYQGIIRQFHDQGIGIAGGFIFGDDLDTKDVFEKTTEFILKSKIDAAQLTILNPLPGTRVYQRLKKEKRLLYTNYPDDWAYYDNLGNVLFVPKNMTSEELFEGILNVYKKTTSKPKSIKRAVTTLYRTKNFWAAGGAFLWNYILGTEFIKKYKNEKQR